MRDLLTRRRTLLALAVGALALAATVVLLTTRGGHAGHAEPANGPTPNSTPTSLGPVNLLHGDRELDGVAVGYPHTTLGAISAAAEYVDDVTSTLDPHYAAAIGRITEDPAATELPQAFATSTVRTRAALELPTSGALAPGVAFLTTPQMYQLRDVSPNRMLVLLLTTNTFTNGAGGMASTTGVYPTLMHWSGTDWHLADIGGAVDYSGLNVTPNSAAASAKGWQPLSSPTGGGS